MRRGPSEHVRIWLDKLPDPETWKGSPFYRVPSEYHLIADVENAGPVADVLLTYEFEMKRVFVDGKTIMCWLPVSAPDGCRFRPADQSAFLKECMYWLAHKESLVDNSILRGQGEGG